MVARNIADAGATQRLLVRTPAQAPKLPGATVHASSYSDPDAVAAALDGVEVLFMVSLPEGPDRVGDHCTFVTAAAKAGVKHIIYTSFINAASDTTFTLGRDHAVTEADIKASGMAYTFLRDNFYIDFMEGLVGDDGVIRGPSGDGRTSVVARADVARSAAAGLQNPQPHRNKTYDMTGPEALSMADIAAIFTEVRGQNENSRSDVPQRNHGRGPRLQIQMGSARLGSGCLDINLRCDRHRRVDGGEPKRRDDHRTAANVATGISCAGVALPARRQLHEVRSHVCGIPDRVDRLRKEATYLAGGARGASSGNSFAAAPVKLIHA